MELGVPFGFEGVGYKLFENKGGRPKTLVHTLHIPGVGRTRLLPLSAAIEKDPGTKGFNFFLSLDAAIHYLPRFKVRAPNLRLCKIWFSSPTSSPLRSSYALSPRILIEEQDWQDSILGANLLIPSLLTHLRI
jgi:hypothetical protein